MPGVVVVSPVDLFDSATRLLGIVYGSQGAQLQQTATNNNLKVELAVGGTLIDPRSIRALTSSDVVDVSDRAVRLLGVTYGSEGAQLKQTATNNNLQTEIAVGGTLIDPRSIRTLTSSDVVDVSDRAVRLLGRIYGSQGAQLKQTATNNNLQIELAVGGTLIDPRDTTVGTVSSGNSTTTPLGISAVFTGTWEEVKDYACITITVFADQNNASNGLEFQWSSDASNVDQTDGSDVTTSSGRAFSITPRGRYFRIVYTNGTSAQGIFRLNTVYHKTGTGLITRPLNTAITDKQYAQLVRAVLTARKPDGTYGNLNLDSSGNLVIVTVPTSNVFFSFGDVVSTAISQIPVRRTTYTEQSSNAQRSIASANANDTSAGTGARTVQITYYTSAGVGPLTETITLNGTTYVNTTNTDICFIEKMEVMTVGSNGSNVGILTLKAATAGGGATIGTINATDNQTFWAHHYVATGKTMKVTGISCSHNGTTVGSGGVFVLKSIPIPAANSAERQISDFVRLYGQASTFARSYNSPVKVVGPARVICYVTSESASTFTYRVSVDFFEE